MPSAGTGLAAVMGYFNRTAAANSPIRVRNDQHRIIEA